MSPLQPGDVVGGKYRIERVLGEGGMGVVVAATRVDLGDQVAVKLLRRELLHSPERVARFTREARAAVKIRSEHVVRIIDVGTSDGQPFIAMDLLEGEDLAERLRRGRLPVPEAIELLLQACDAIAAAHRAHVIHRDLKPANLFVTRRANGDPVLKVLDFGISKLTSDHDVVPGSVTRTSTMLGSPTYMSPEQLRSSRDVDERTDVWSLGVVAFELVAGRPPFDLPSVPEVCSAILTSPAPLLRSLRPSVPPAFEAVVERCLRKDPEERYKSVDALAEALRAAIPSPETNLGTAVTAIVTGPSNGSPLTDLASLACAKTDMAERIPATVPLAPEPAAMTVREVEVEVEPEPEAPIALVRLAPVAVSASSRSVWTPDARRRSRGEDAAFAPAIAWPPPTHGARAWIAFVLASVALVAAVSALVAARMGWQLPLP